MAQNRKVNPICSYASNPYHECTESCLRKIRENQPQKDNKSSGAITLKFGWKKKPDSKPEPPVLDSVPTSRVRTTYRSEKKKLEPKTNENISPDPVSLENVLHSVPASRVRTTYRSEKKLEPKTNENISPEPVSLENRIQDVKPVYQKDQAKDVVEHFANKHTQTFQEDEKKNLETNHTETNQQEKKASDRVDPSTYADDTGEGLTASLGKLLDFSFSGISIANGNEDSDEETQSIASEGRVPVGRYHVRESYAPILLSIFDKYGDIGANFQLESTVMRTHYIECVCFVVKELHSTSITQFTKSKVKELLAIVKDVESVQVQVTWLRKILEEVAEHIELINQCQNVETAKANSYHEVESLREELESEMKTLAQKEQEVAAIKTRISETTNRLKELELKCSELDKSMSLIKSKIDSLDGKSLIDELL